MEKTWKPTVAGILNIISGAFALIWSIILVIGIIITSGKLGIPGTEAIPPFVSTILLLLAVPSIIIGVLALMGGIYSIQRESWKLVLAGSIATTVFWFFVGIPTIVFVAQSRNEFGET